MKGDGLFSGDEDFAGFLGRLGADPSADGAFPARNFLLDEGLTAQRLASYRAAGCLAGHGDLGTWVQ